jgi:hypothetical protein
MNSRRGTTFILVTALCQGGRDIETPKRAQTRPSRGAQRSYAPCRPRRRTKQPCCFGQIQPRAELSSVSGSQRRTPCGERATGGTCLTMSTASRGHSTLDLIPISGRPPKEASQHTVGIGTSGRTDAEQWPCLSLQPFPGQHITNVEIEGHRVEPTESHVRTVFQDNKKRSHLRRRTAHPLLHREAKPVAPVD